MGPGNRINISGQIECTPAQRVIKSLRSRTMSAPLVNPFAIETMMNTEAFERFEKTRRGLLIPVLLFVVGAVATLIAIKTVHGVAVEQLERSAPADPGDRDADAAAELPRAEQANESAVPERGQAKL